MGNQTTNITEISVIVPSSVSSDGLKITNNKSSTNTSAQESTLLLESREDMMEKNAEFTVLQTKTDKPGMPAGIVAVISTISFATIAVIAYAGLIAWKRYQE